MGYTWIMSGYGIFELEGDKMRNQMSNIEEDINTFRSRMDDGTHSKEATVEKLDRDHINSLSLKNK